VIRKRYARHVAWKGNACKMLSENLKQEDDFENLDIDGRIMLKWILKECE
jgi:hypothetical protein